MAKSRVQPLLLLLMPFFFSSALATLFYNCSTSSEFPFEVRSVEISPVPVVRNGNANIHITGLSRGDVPHGLTVTIILDVNGHVVSARTYPICDDDVTPCFIEPGGPFEISLLNIFSAQETRTAVQYQVSVRIVNDLGERMMCIVFHCIVNSLAKVRRPSLIN